MCVVHCYGATVVTGLLQLKCEFSLLEWNLSPSPGCRPLPIHAATDSTCVRASVIEMSCK